MAKNIGFKSILTVTTTTGAAEIGQIRNISGPGVSANDVDTTCLDSSSNYRTFSCGLLDPGEVTFGVAYDPTMTTHKRLAEYMGTRSAKTFTVYHASSTGDTDAFTAYVKGMGREIPLDDLITCDYTLKVTGIPAYTT
jgi:hypothetical protein